MSHHNANTVVKHARCHCEKIKGVILRQVCYTHLSITIKNRVAKAHFFVRRCCYDSI